MSTGRTFLLVLLALLECDAIMFSDKSNSFARYKQWNISSTGELEMKFKTNSRFCTLLYIDGQKESTHAGDTSARTTDITNNYSYLEAGLIHGRLKISVQLTPTIRKYVKISKKLNDLKWHRLRITKYFDSFNIKVDDNKSDRISFSSDVVKKFRIRSDLYIGGLSKEKKKTSPTSVKYKPSFFGCISYVKYSSGNFNMEIEDTMKIANVASKCTDECASNPCTNRGVCVNYFTRAECDCSSTGYEGDRCTIPAPSIHVNETGYLKLDGKKGINTDSTTRLGFRFKARQPNGVLFYTKRDGNVLAVELLAGKLRVAAGKATEEPREVVMNRELMDKEWHAVTIQISDSIIYTTIDGRINDNLTASLHPPTKKSKMEPIYFGGVELPRFYIKSKKNFVGCLQQMFYNTVDVMFQLQRTHTAKFGDVKEGCPELVEVPATRSPFNVGTKKYVEKIHTRETGLGQNVIIWITTAIVIGTIIILISAACVVHHMRLRYHQTQSMNKASEDEMPMNEKQLPEDRSNESSRATTPTIEEGGKILKCKEADDGLYLMKDSESESGA